MRFSSQFRTAARAGDVPPFQGSIVFVMPTHGLHQWATKMSGFGLCHWTLSRLGNFAMLSWSLLLKNAHELAHPCRMIGPGAGGNHVSIDNRFAVDEIGSGGFYVRLQRRIGCCSSALERTCRG